MGREAPARGLLLAGDDDVPWMMTMTWQVDDSTKKNFLKKIAYPNVTFDELFLGGAICMCVVDTGSRIMGGGNED